MLNKLKRITESQKLRILVLFAVVALVAAVVVLAFDGGYEYPEYYGGYGYYGEHTPVYYYYDDANYDYEHDYSYAYEDYHYYGYDYAQVVPFYTATGVEYADYYLELYMYQMGGYAGDAPVMMYDPYE